MPLIDDETDDGEIQNSSVPTQQKSVKENGLPAKLDWLNEKPAHREPSNDQNQSVVTCLGAEI